MKPQTVSFPEYLQMMLREVIRFSDSNISCAEGRLRLLLIETFPVLLSSGVPGSSWIAQYKKEAVSI